MKHLDNAHYLISNIKLAGMSVGTTMIGFWGWLGENQSSIGALASMVGMCGVVVSIYRSGKELEADDGESDS